MKIMLLVKASSDVEKTMHCLTQIMLTNDRLGLDLDTPSLYLAKRLLLSHCTRPHQLSQALLSMLLILSDLLTYGVY